MKEYNLLTRQLLAAGYTADKFPDYVQIATGQFTGNDPLNNLSGGFEYKRWKKDEFVYKTGCGMYIKGRNVMDNMGYMGVEWQHENNNPVFRCPFDKPECTDNDIRLHGMSGGGLCIQCFCTCHRTNEEYDYDRSIEKANDDRQAEMDRKYQEYSNAHGGRICRNHMFYNERTREWTQRYQPARCAYMCYAGNGYCPILGKQLSKKRGNVYYDLETVHTRRDGTLWDGEQYINVRKNIRYFKKPCSMDICEAFVKLQKDKIVSDYRTEHPRARFEILNVRAESRPSRDLEQDLADLQAGMHISFDDVDRKKAREAKKIRRQQAQEKRIARLEKKIIKVGYENLEEYSLDRVHADKWLGVERIDELEKIRQQKIKEEQEKPVQLSLFDMI